MPYLSGGRVKPPIQTSSLYLHKTFFLHAVKAIILKGTFHVFRAMTDQESKKGQSSVPGSDSGNSNNLTDWMAFPAMPRMAPCMSIVLPVTLSICFSLFFQMPCIARFSLSKSAFI